MIKHRLSFAISIAVGFIGLLFYANFRSTPLYFDSIPGFSLLQLVSSPILLPQSISEWLPSFLFVIGMTLFTSSLLPYKKAHAFTLPVMWFAIAATFEFAQLPQQQAETTILALGNFEWVDVVALFAGAAISSQLIAYLHRNHTDQVSQEANVNCEPLNRITTAMSIMLGCGLILGSYGPTILCTFPDGEDRACEVDPIYLSYSQLRQSDFVYFSAENATTSTQRAIDEGAKVQEFAGLKNPGKIYVYGDLLLINEYFHGVAIFDNTNPESPKFNSRIIAVGATDIEVKDDILYTNSFTDLIAVDLNFPFTYKRNKDVIPYPNYESWLPDRIRLYKHTDEHLSNQEAIDKRKGVLVGYRADDGTEFYFWNHEL